MPRATVVSGSVATRTFGSECDGAFAQYVKVEATEVFPVNCDWSDAELGTIPCAYGTAENMLHRAHVSGGEHVWAKGSTWTTTAWSPPAMMERPWATGRKTG